MTYKRVSDEIEISDKYKPDLSLITIGFDELILDKNIRSEITIESVLVLIHSIYREGVKQPITVYGKGKKYVVLLGNRRYKAMKFLRENKIIPAYGGYDEMVIDNNSAWDIIDCLKSKKPENDAERKFAQLSENTGREDVDNIAYAQTVVEFLEIEQITHDKLATRLGKGRVQITEFVAIHTKIEEPIMEKLREIQKYGISKSALTTHSKNVVMTTFPIAVGPLKKIARAQDQKVTFWKLFKSKLTEDDAKDIGLDLSLIEDNKPRSEIFEAAFEIKYLGGEVFKNIKRIGAEDPDKLKNAATRGALKEYIILAQESLLKVQELIIRAEKADARTQLSIDDASKETDADIPSTVHSTVHSTKVQLQQLPQIDLFIKYNNKDVDLSDLTTRYPVNTILYSVLDLVFYNRANTVSKKVINLKSLVVNNLKTGKVQKYIPDMFEDDNVLDEGLVRYITNGCPKGGADFNDDYYGKETILYLNDLYNYYKAKKK